MAVTSRKSGKYIDISRKKKLSELTLTAYGGKLKTQTFQ
jgi:hypothetical protein